MEKKFTEKTIRIVGTGRMKVRPDLTKVDLTIEGMEEEYSRVLELSAQKTEQLWQIFAGLGFQRSDLKTTGFHINPNYEEYQEMGLWKRKMKGYKFTHTTKVEFPLNNELLGEILTALGNYDTDAALNIQYSVADPEQKKQELLAEAIAKSREKAEIIARAAGVTLGAILTIDYAWENEDIFAFGTGGRMNYMAPRNAKMMAECNLNVEPDDIEIEDNIAVVWSLQ